MRGARAISSAEFPDMEMPDMRCIMHNVVRMGFGFFEPPSEGPDTRNQSRWPGQMASGDVAEGHAGADRGSSARMPDLPTVVADGAAFRFRQLGG